MKSVTDLEIEEAIREAWTILYAEPATAPLARRLAAALLAVTGGTQAQPHWVTPDDLWRDRLTVLADSGVRSGLDVVRMLALGAKGVLLGRAFIYALAARGEVGVTQLLDLIEKEMRVAMALTGVRDLASIDRSILAEFKS